MTRSNLKKGIALTLTSALALSIVSHYTAGDPAMAKTKLKVSVKSKKVTINVGDTYKIKLKNLPSKAKVTWKSSKKKIATVNSKGKVTAKQKGTAVISATIKYKGVKKAVKCTITVNDKKVKQTPSAEATQAATVTQAPVSVNTPAPTKSAATKAPDSKKLTSISFNTDSVDLDMNASFKLKPAISPTDATLNDCDVVNSKDYIASVASDGTVTAKYIGTTYITLRSKSDPSVSATLQVNVTDDFSQPKGFNEYNENIAHGTMGDLNYPSDYRPQPTAHARVWYPPNYDENKKYNVLFCLHGGSDNEYYWTGHSSSSNGGCRGDYVLDSLYATGQMEDTIVIFPHGVIQYDENRDYPNVRPNKYLHSDNDFWVNHYLFEFELINNLLPYAKENLPIYGTPEHMAVCGLSMGCAQSMEIGFNNPDLFDYIGSFSAGPFEDMDQEFINSEEDSEKINEKIKLWFFITGENDHLHDNSLRKFLEVCRENKLNHVFYEVPGVGHDDYCWDMALYTFMRYTFK